MCFLSENIDDLLVQKTASANAYIGIAVVGAYIAYLNLDELAYALQHPEAIVVDLAKSEIAAFAGLAAFAGIAGIAAFAYFRLLERSGYL